MTEETKPASPWLPIALYLFISFAAYSPCLIGQKAYYANDLLYFFGPMRAFLTDRLAHGSFPLWNPYIFCGQPFFADLQNMMLYPLHYLSLPFSVPYGLSVFFFLHMFFAACGMHLWLKSLKLSAGSCVIGSLAYSLSGFFWWEMIHPPVLAGFACLPWLFYTLEKLSRELKWNWALFCGMAFALLFLAGSLQVTLEGFYGGAAYLLLRIKPQNFGAETWKALLQSKEFRKKVLTALFFIVWGSLPLFGQLIPTAEFSKYSVRRTPDLTYENFNGAFSLQPSNLSQFLFPTFSLPAGKTMEEAIQDIHQGSEVDFLGNYGYIGIWIPLLLFLAVRRKDKKLMIFLLSGALLCLLVSFGKHFFVHRLFCEAVPGFDIIRAPYRFIYFYVLCACALAAWGYQELERAATQKERHPFLFTGLVIYCVLFVVVSLINIENTWREAFAAALGLAGLVLWFQTESWQKLGKLLFQTAFILPLLFFGWSTWTAADPSNYSFEKNSILSQIALPSKGRIVIKTSVPYLEKVGGKTYGTYFPGNAVMPLKLRSVDGYNPLHLKKTEKLLNGSSDVVSRLMGVEEIVSGQDQKEIPGFDHQNLGGYYHIYHAKGPSSYVSAPSQTQVVPDSDEQVKMLQNPDFLPSLALLEKPLPASFTSQLSGKPAELTFERTLDEPDHQIFQVQLDSPSLVVFSEVVYPGWKAWIDGQPSEIFTSNSLFRGLCLTKGAHQVDFKYQPLWWPWIPLGLVLWLLSVLSLGWFRREKKI